MKLTWDMDVVTGGGAPVMRLLRDIIGYAIRLNGDEVKIVNVDDQYQSEGGVRVTPVDEENKVAGNGYWVNIYDIETLHIY